MRKAFTDEIKPRFTVLSQLSQFICTNFAPIYGTKRFHYYSEMKRENRKIYGLYSGVQFINEEEFKTATQEEIAASITKNSTKLKSIVNNLGDELWSDFLKINFHQKDFDTKIRSIILPRPQKPKDTELIIKTRSMKEESVEEAARKAQEEVKRSKKISNSPEITSSLSTHLSGGRVTSSEIWFESFWKAFDTLDPADYDAELSVLKPHFSSLGFTSLSLDHFLPILIDGTNFLEKIVVSQDLLVATVHALGSLQGAISTDKLLTILIPVNIYLVRTKNTLLDRNPLYFLNVIIDDDSIYEFLPVDPGQKSIMTISAELRSLDHPFTTIYYESQPSQIDFSLNFGTFPVSGDFPFRTPLVKLHSMTYFRLSSVESSTDAISYRLPKDETVLTRENVGIFYTMNYPLSITTTLRSCFQISNAPIQGKYYVEGSFYLQNERTNTANIPNLTNKSNDNASLAGISLKNLFDIPGFSLLRPSFFETIQIYEILNQAFEHPLETYLPDISVHQLEGSFLGYVDNIVEFKEFASNIRLLDIRSIVQLKIELEICNQKLSSINLHFAADFEYDDTYSVATTLSRVVSHDLKIEGVIETSKDYQFNIIYSFGDISTLEIKKSKLISLQASLSSFEFMGKLPTFEPPPLDFFGEVLYYFPTYLRFSILDDFSFGGIEVTFDYDFNIELSTKTRLKTFWLMINYFPKKQTEIYASAKFTLIDQTNLEKDLPLGRFSFNYNYTGGSHTVGATISFDSEASISTIINLFVDLDDKLQQFPVSRSILDNLVLNTISMRYNLSNKILEQFHLHIATIESIPIIDEYLKLAYLDIRYVNSSKSFHFQGLLESKFSSIVVTVGRVSSNDDTSWVVEGTSLQPVTTVPNFTDIYSKIKTSDTMKSFIDTILEYLPLNVISLDINTTKNRILFYLEIATLKIGFIYDNGSVNLLSSLSFAVSKKSVNLRDLYLHLDSQSHLVQITSQPGDNSNNFEDSLDGGKENTSGVDAEFHDNAENLPVQTSSSSLVVSLPLTKQSEYNWHHNHQRQQQQHLNKQNLTPQYPLDDSRNNHKSRSSNSSMTIEVLDDTASLFNELKSTTTPPNYIAPYRCDVTPTKTTMSCSSESLSSLHDDPPTPSPDYTNEKDYLGDYDDTINKMGFLFSESLITIGCVYMNKLKRESFEHHQYIRKMVDETLHELGLDSQPEDTQDKTFFAFSFSCTSDLITGLRKIQSPSKSFHSNNKAVDTINVADITEYTDDKLIFSIVLDTTNLSFKISAAFRTEQHPIYFGNWFELTLVEIAASYTAPATAKICLTAGGRIPNGPFLNGGISGSLNNGRVECGVDLTVDLWAQPFSIDWLFMDVSIGGTLAIAPVVLISGVRFHGNFYVIPRDMQQDIKKMVDPTKQQLQKILEDIEQANSIHVEAEVNITLSQPRFYFKIHAQHLKLSRILRDIFLKDIDESSTFNKVEIVEGFVECDFQVGKISNLGVAGKLELVIGEFNLYLKAGYERDRQGSKFKAAGAMSKLELFNKKLIITSASEAGLYPIPDGNDEFDILDFIRDDIDVSKFKDGPLFALSVSTGAATDNYFMFSGGIILYGITAAFLGRVETNRFYLQALLQIVTDSVQFSLEVGVFVQKDTFTFSSALDFHFACTTPSVSFFGINIIPSFEIVVEVKGSILVNITSSGLKISGNAGFKLDISKNSENVLLLELSTNFDLKPSSFADIALKIINFIIKDFPSLIVKAFKKLFNRKKSTVAHFGDDAKATAAISKKMGNTAQETIRWLSGKSEDEIKDAIQSVYNINDEEWDKIWNQVGPQSTGYLIQWRDGELYNSKRFGHGVYSLLGLQNEVDTYSRIIPDQTITNVKTMLSSIFTQQAQNAGHKELFRFDTELFVVMVDATPEHTMNMMKSFTDFEHLRISSEYLLDQLIANRTSTSLTQRGILQNIVSHLPSYYNELKQVGDVLLQQWFRDKDTVLPALLESLQVAQNESRTLAETISSAIMDPFILHLEFFSILLHNLQPVLGLADIGTFFQERVANIGCIILSQALVASHYNSALLYPGIHANGTLVTVDNVDCVILDSRLHSIAEGSFFKKPTKSVNMDQDSDVHPFYTAVGHAPNIQHGSSLIAAQLHRVLFHNETIHKYAIAIHGHLRCISNELLAMISDSAKATAIDVNKTDYAPGLDLHMNTSFLQGFATGFQNAERITLANTDDVLDWSCVNYEYGSIDLDSFLYPAIITVQETNDVIFRLTPDFIFRVDPTIPIADVTNLISKLYQECYLLVDLQSAFRITLPLHSLSTLLLQDIKRVVHIYKPSFTPTPDFTQYIQNLPLFKKTSTFKLIHHTSIADIEKSYQLIFGAENDYFQTSFLTKRPRSLQNEDNYQELKDTALTPDQIVSELCIAYQQDIDIYTEDNNDQREMKEGVYAMDVTTNATIIIPSSVVTLGFGAFRNSNIQQLVFESGSIVRSIDHFAFSGCTHLMSIVLPISLLSIGEYAFQGCVGIKTITIPASVTFIADNVLINSGLTSMHFMPNTQLESVFIPASVLSIQDDAFKNSGLRSITFESGSVLNSLGKRAFSGCRNLTSIRIPSSVAEIQIEAFTDSGLSTITFEQGSILTSIDTDAFSNCRDLESIIIPQFVTTLGVNVFKESGLRSITLEEGSRLTAIKTGAFYGCSQLISTYDHPLILPESATEIGAASFKDSGITHIHIPASITTVGTNAFENSDLATITFADDCVIRTLPQDIFLNCTNLSAINIPHSVGEIEENAFKNSGLTTITLSNLTSLTRIAASAFYGCSGIDSIEVPSSLTEIGEYAFSKSGLQSITFTDESTLTRLGEGAFLGCTSLTQFSMPALVSGIHASTFKESGLVSIAFPETTSLTTIAAEAFSGCVDLLTITIPASITTIGENAFKNSNLETITFASESTLKTIGNFAFSGCRMIQSIDLPASVDAIGIGAFAHSSVVNVTLGSAITIINQGTFIGCTTLNSIAIPAGVVTIEKSAFSYSGVTNVSFASNSTLKTIASLAFSGCQNLASIVIPTSVSTIAADAFINSGLKTMNFEPATLLKSIAIPSSVTTIGDNAFKDSNIETVTFAAGSLLTKINTNTFSGCRSLTSIAIPPFVTIIGSSAFKDSNVTNVEFTKTSSLEKINDSAFYGCGNLNSITIPDSVTVIDQRVFQKSGLTQITFTEESKLTKINDSAFSECDNLNIISIPSSVIMIAENAFDNSGLTTMNFMPVTKLKSIVIPSSVTTIGESAFKNSELQFISFALGSKLAMIDKDTFSGCKNLSSVIIPTSVTSINTNAFRDSGLTSVIFEGTKITTIQDYAFYGCMTLTTITIPSSVAIIANTTFDNSGLKTMNFLPLSQLTSIVIPASVTEIGDISFMSSSLSSITFAKGSALQTIGESVFYDCQDLSYITLPASTTIIGKQAFMNSALKSIVFSAVSKLTNIASKTFSGCIFLNSIIIPASVAVIADDAFNNSGLQTMNFESGTKLTSITIPASVITIEGSVVGVGAFQNSSLGKITFATGSVLENIGEKALLGCQNITSIHIPASVTKIQEGAFQESGLGEITFDEESDLVKIGKNAFYKCIHLTEIDIPKYVETIGVDAFRESGIESIRFDINSTLTYIDAGTFKGCTRLTSIEIPASVEVIGESAFENSGLTKITFAPNSRLHTIKARAFFGCKNLISIKIPSSITTIADDAFQESGLEEIDFGPNTGLKSVVIPAFVTTIKDRTFANSGLEKITFAEGSVIRSIGKEAFYACKNLTSITIPPTLSSLADTAFDQSGLTSMNFMPGTQLISITIPASVITINNAAFKNSNLNAITFAPRSSLASIGIETFMNCQQLSSIDIPVSVMIIGQDAFRQSGLEHITFAENSALTTIDTRAFYLCNKLSSITIPASVTTIGLHAFMESGLKTVELASKSTLDVINNGAFSMCKSLTSFTIPSSVMTIGESAFENSGLTSITFHSRSLTVIHKKTFYGCGSLTSISIPTSVTTIGEYSFYGCQSLLSIIIPASVSSISSTAFNNSGLTSITFNPGTQLTSIIIPATVTTINDSAFKNSKLESITFAPGSSLLTIGTQTFYNCKNLVSITIPTSVTGIDHQAFQDCLNLNTIKFDGVSQLKTIGSNAFYNCSSLTSIAIPPNVTTIGSYAFYFCYSLTSIAIPPNVTIIEPYTFFYCDSLAPIIIPSTVTTIGSAAFSYCSSLVSITIPLSVNTIGSDAFAYCSSLISITIPSSITTISSYTFSYCSSLASITIPSSVTTIESGAFSNCSSLASIKIPSSMTTIGSTAFSSCASLASITIPSSVATIGYGAFSTCSSLASITIPSSVTAIESFVFNECSSLASITIPSSITTIGAYAFSDCSSLTSLVIPASVTEIGESTFSDCVKLKTIRFVEVSQLKVIGLGAFVKCSSLTSITIPSSVITIGNDAFEDCGITIMNFEPGTKLKHISIPASVTKIGDSAFENSGLASIDFASGSKLSMISKRMFMNCKDLTSINIPASVTTIGDHAFIRCVRLSEVKLPASLTTMGISSFHTCDSLRSITIPAAVTTSGTHVFYNCKALQRVIFEGTRLTRIENQTFQLCENLTEIELPDSITAIGHSAFNTCKSLRSITIPSAVTRIGTRVFSRCDALVEIEIPKSVESLESEVFAESGITKVTFQSNSIIQLIPTRAFYQCKKLISVDLPPSVTILSLQAFAESSISEFTYPGLTSVGQSAFAKCFNLKSFIIAPSNISLIRSRAFEDSGLEDVYYQELPGNFPNYTIEYRAFYGCKSLKTAKLHFNTLSIGPEAFAESSIETITFYPAAYNLDILNRAFYKCTNLVSIEIPRHVKTLGTEVFRESGLTKATFGFSSGSTSGLKIIPARTFYKCIDLISFNATASTTEINEGAFGFCKDLDFILLKRSSKITINRSAFEGVDTPPQDSQINWVD